MLRVILFLVASFVRKSFRIEMVEMLSDLKDASPFLCDSTCKKWRVINECYLKV